MCVWVFFFTCPHKRKNGDLNSRVHACREMNTVCVCVFFTYVRTKREKGSQTSDFYFIRYCYSRLSYLLETNTMCYCYIHVIFCELPWPWGPRWAGPGRRIPFEPLWPYGPQQGSKPSNWIGYTKLLLGELSPSCAF